MALCTRCGQDMNEAVVTVMRAGLRVNVPPGRFVGELASESNLLSLARADAGGRKLLTLAVTVYDQPDEPPLSEATLARMAIEGGIESRFGEVTGTASGQCAFGTYGTAVFRSDEFPQSQVWYLCDGRSFIHATHLCETPPNPDEITETQMLIEQVVLDEAAAPCDPTEGTSRG